MRWILVLLASLALHAVLLWAWAREPHPTPLATRPRLQWVDVAPAPAAARVEPAPTPAQAQLRKRKKLREDPQPASGAPAATDAPTRTPGSAGGTLVSSERGDVPLARRPDLIPGPGAVLRMAPAADAEPSHGTTVRNGPGEEEDPVAAREVAGERLTRNLNATLLEDVGRAAVAVGTVPGHFRRAEDSLRALVKRTRVDVTAPTAGDTARDVALVLLPGGISPEASRRVTDTPLGYAIANQNVSVPTIDDQRFRESAMSLLAATEELKKRVQEPRLKAILELVTDPYGAVANAIVVERSGDRKFDESVLHLSRKAFRALPDNDEKALGSSWWKTTWQFTWAPPPFPGLQADVRVQLLDAHRIPPVQ